MRQIIVVLLIFINPCNNTLYAQNGLLGEYYNGTNFDKKIFERNDPKIDFNWGLKGPKPGFVDGSYYSIKWTGFITIPETGKYGFSALVDDGFRVWVNNVLILDSWELHNSKTFKRYAMLTEGKSYPIRIEYFNDLLHGVFKLLWSLPNQESQPIGTQYLTIYKPKLAPKIEPAQSVKPLIVQINTKPKKVENPIILENKIEPPMRESENKIAPKIELEKQVLLDEAPKSKIIFFPIGADSLTENSKILIEKLYNFMKAHPKAKLKLNGHSDIIGDKKQNFELSKMRAETIENYLINRGIDKNRLTKIYSGSAFPIYQKPQTEDEHAANRRVEFEFTQ